MSVPTHVSSSTTTATPVRVVLGWAAGGFFSSIACVSCVKACVAVCLACLSRSHRCRWLLKERPHYLRFK